MNSSPISTRFGRISMPRGLARELAEPESGVVKTNDPRLLIVEHDRLDQALINVLLRKAGMESADRDFVSTMADALPLLRTGKYTHIIADVSIADLDPAELLVERKASSLDTAVVFLADVRSPEQASALIRAGAEDYVVKEEQEGRTFRQVLIHATERRRAHRRLTYALQHDSTSGLPNWTLFAKHWAPKLRQARQTATEAGLLVLRLENFGRIVATLGSTQSHQLIAIVGEHLERVLGRYAVGHLGGERFVACLEAHDQARLSAEVLYAAREAVRTNAKGVPVVVRAGLAFNSVVGPDLDDMLAAAYEAVDEAERLNNDLQCFDTSLSALTARRRALEDGLREALSKGEISLHYQPKVEIATGRVVGTEALMRWTRGEERINPAEFIPILERTGLIDEFGMWALREACHQESKWRKSNVRLGSVAVNLSSRQLRDANLVEAVRSVLEEFDTPPEHLQLELTESSLIGDVDSVVSIMQELKILGVKLGLDDFGTGYSSMAYLQHLPFDVLKVDRSFVKHLGTTHISQTIADGIVSLGRALEMHVVAEGVETVEQLEVLRRINCHAAQGYLFSRPLPPEQLDTSGSYSIPH
jgi:EAL domain-containing protein (putative c-di-GMP-specific phosphodiesterase class I)/GGDEF domain-containing protein